LIIDELEGRVRKIDDETYALVFIDGVLQEEGKSYQIVGPNITFNSPLTKYKLESGEEIYQKVSIVVPYGRNTGATLTFFDFEPNTYYNEIRVKLTGDQIATQFKSLYDTVSNFELIVAQQDNIIGKIRTISKVNDDEIILAVSGHNLSQVNSTDNLKLINVDETEITTEIIEVPVEYIYDWNVVNSELGYTFNPNNSTVEVLNPLLNVGTNGTLKLNVNAPGDPLHSVTNLKDIVGENVEYSFAHKSRYFCKSIRYFNFKYQCSWLSFCYCNRIWPRRYI
jgi:hypothetical protein